MNPVFDKVYAHPRFREVLPYVELVKRKINTPSRITKEKAFDLLKYVLIAIEKSGDIGFNGYHCLSTAQSESQAEELLAQAKEAFLHCDLS